jgi:hypothetical protein
MKEKDYETIIETLTKEIRSLNKIIEQYKIDMTNTEFLKQLIEIREKENDKNNNGT